MADGDEDEAWPQDLDGGDDAYGDSLDSGWLASLSGQRLGREAEFLVAASLLKRDDPERACQWRDVFKSEEVSKLMDMKSIRDLWTQKHAVPMSGTALSALCLRFGPCYADVLHLLDEAEREPTSLTSLRKKAWAQLTPKKARETLALSTVIDTDEVVLFLEDWEQRLEIIEIQISRAGHLLDEIRGDAATPKNLKGLLVTLGMPGVAPRQLFPVCASAMIFARLRPEMPCPLGKLEKYCIARCTRSQSDGPQLKSVKAQFRALLRPVAYAREVKLRGMQLESPDRQALDQDEEEEEEEEEEDEEVDGSPSRRRRRRQKKKFQHVLTLWNSLPRGLVKTQAASYVLLAALEANFPNLSSAFLFSLVWMWSGDVSITATSGGLVLFDTLETFFSPQGFGLRVRLPAQFGSLRIGHGKLKATDSTAVLYAMVLKTLFNGLRQVRFSDTNLRVPSDLVLYADEEREVKIPRDRCLIARVLDDGSRVYAQSQYVLDLLEKDKEDEAAAKDPRGMIVNRRPASAPEAGAGAGAGSPTTASGPGPRPPKVGTIQAALARLTKLAKPVDLLPNPPFPGVESEAHQWGAALMVKYLREELELPDYEDTFRAKGLSGLDFIKLDGDEIRRTLQLKHALHVLKMDTYAEMLRERVFEKAVVTRPAKLEAWEAVHVAGWVRHKLGCRGAALCALRADLDGEKLAKADEAELVKSVGGEGGPEAEVAVEGLLKLRESKKAQSGRNSPKMVAAVDSLNSEEGADGTEGQEEEKAQPEGAVIKKASRLKEKRNRLRAEAEADAEDEAAIGEEEGKGEAGAEEPPPAFQPKGKGKKNKKASQEPAAPASDEESRALALKIAALQSELLEQQKAVRRLEDAAAAAKKEKAAAERRLKEEQAAAGAAQAALVGVRGSLSAAQGALDTLGGQFLSEMKSRKRSQEEELRGLAQETADLQAAALAAKQQAAEAAATAAAAASAPTPVAPVPALAFAQATPAAAVAAVASVSVAGASIPTASPLPASAVSKEAGSAPAPAAATAAGAAPAAASAAKAQAPAPTPARAAAPAPASAAAAPAFEEPPARFTEAPLSSARPLALSSALVGRTSSDAEPAGGEERSMKEVMNQTAATEVRVWKRLLRRYKHRAGTNMTVPDTTAQLSRVAVLWLRLGMQMLDDARARILPPPGGSSKPQAPRAAAGAGVDEDDEEEDEEEDLGPPSDAEVEALRGLQRCARQLLQVHDDAVAAAGAAAAAAGTESASKAAYGPTPPEEKILTKIRVRPASHAALPLSAKASSAASSSRKHDYDLAVGMVFCLGLVKRLMDRYPEPRDRTNLLFLFTRLREGSLPLSELSRENFRSLLTTTLHVALPAWAHFDSLCQRLDPEGKGWIPAQRALHVFANLNPLSEGLGPGDAQGLALLLLTLASAGLARKNKDCSDAFVDLVTARASHVASFAALARGEFDKGADSPSSWAGADEANNAKENEATGTGNQPAGGVAESKRSRLADETHLVRDLLLELSLDFVAKQTTTTNTAATTAAAGASSTLAHAGDSRRPSGSKEEWRRSRASTSCPLSFIPPTAHNLSAACHLVARVLSVYEGRGSLLLTAVGTVLVSHLLFRRAVLLRMRSAEERAEKEKEAAAAAGQTSSRLKQQATMFLTLPQIRSSLGHVEACVYTLLGSDKAAAALKRADSMRVEEHERLCAELAGCPVPHGGVLGLVASQEQVETYVYHQSVKMRDAELVSSLELQNKSYSSTLKDIQSSLLSQIKLGAVATTRSGSPTKAGQGTMEVGNAYQGVIGEMNSLMFKQRVEQTAQYLEHINAKAARKRKLLEAALQLWTASKELTMSPSKRRQTGLYDADVMTITASGSGATVDVPLLRVSSPQELAKRANEVLRTVMDDMQKSGNPSAPLQQLAVRINAIKRGISQGSIVDEDHSLALMLREISVLEQGLLQANEDCVAICERVLEKVSQQGQTQTRTRTVNTFNL